MVDICYLEEGLGEKIPIIQASKIGLVSGVKRLVQDFGLPWLTMKLPRPTNT